MNSIHFRQLRNPELINGTSFFNDFVYATPNEMKYLLGEPTFEQNDGKGKVNMEWFLEMEDGNVITVYDYKRTLYLNFFFITIIIIMMKHNIKSGLIPRIK